MSKQNYRQMIVYLLLLVLAIFSQIMYAGIYTFSSGTTLSQLVGSIGAILLFVEIINLLTRVRMIRMHKPAVEAAMIGRIYQVVAAIVIILVIANTLGQLAAFASFFAMFGGMLLGWSLQAPVSGFAAWLLVSMKRPFRPGDRNFNLVFRRRQRDRPHVPVLNR